MAIRMRLVLRCGNLHGAAVGRRIVRHEPVRPGLHAVLAPCEHRVYEIISLSPVAPSKLDVTLRAGMTTAERREVVTMSPDSRRLSFAQTIALVNELADKSERVAAGLRALHEPEAAALVARLADDAARAAAALRKLLEPTPQPADWYQVHRALWVRYGDPGDLAAMTDHVTEAN
jgi:hypothetical protein